MTRLILALASALVLSPTLTFAQARARYGIVLYDPPAGWAGQDKDNLRMLIAPDKSAVLIFLPSKPLDGTLDPAANEILSESGARPECREEAGPTGGPHATSGGQRLTFTYSCADANRPDQYLYNWVVLVAAGGRYATLSGTFTSASAFNTHVPTLGRLVDGVSLATTIQIEPGNPALTRYMLDETTDFLE